MKRTSCTTEHIDNTAPEGLVKRILPHARAWIALLALGIMSQGFTFAETVGVTLNSTSGTLNPSQSLSLTAMLSGTANKTVAWSLSPAVGSLNTSGNTTVYTAPATIASTQTVTIKATSVVDPTKSASAVINLVSVPTVAISLNVTTGTLNPSQSQSLTATVTGTTNTAVTWSLNPAVGSLKTSGNTTVYTAPATITSAQTVTITATSSANAAKTASAIVSLVPAVAISLNATTGTLNSSQSQSLTATVTGTTNTAVTWSLNPAAGSLKTSGNTTVYTAPATITSAQTVTITATSSANPAKTASAIISLVPTVAISLNSTTGTLSPSQSQSLTATVTGTTNTAVTWSFSPAVGSLAASGNTAVYVAPVTIGATQTVTVTATSSANSTKTASAVISLVPALTITSSSVTLTNSQTTTLVASGAGASGVTWSFSPAVGTLIATGTTAVYTVPVTLSQSQTIQVQATSVSNTGLFAKVALMLVPTVAISVTPSSADLYAAGTQAFAATVTGSANSAVQWSLSPSVGTISNTGVYSAPATIAQDATVNLTVVAQADTTKRVTLPIRLHSAGVSFTTNSNGLQSVIFNGKDYNYVYGEGLLTLVYTQPPNGTARQFTPTCTGTFTPVSVTKNCTAGGDSFALTVSYSTPSLNTVQAQIAFTNNSKTNTVTNAMLSTFGINMAQFDQANSIMGLSEFNPLSIINFATGRMAIWDDTPGPNVAFNQSCGFSYICKNQPELLNVGPGQTANASFSVRFTNDMTETQLALAPEAFTAYQAAYPSVVNWPDRRPIYAWFTSDHGHQSAINPRGYFNNPLMDVSNIAGFQATALAQAQTILTSIKARPVQPQGIVLWDVEGQEFIQATTYVGDPRVLSQGYSPEMNAAADQVFALFRNAGLKVGITLRPDYLQWGPGASLPATCNFNSNHDFMDLYIAVDAPLLQKFYACYAPNVWSLIPAGNGEQTVYQSTQFQQVINLLLSKVAYARARWGTTIYYVDSTVWSGGAPMTAAIFRALQLAYPDSLFMPEESYIGTMAAAIPYAAPNGSLNSLFSPSTWRYAYPNGAQATNLSNCSGTCWTADASSFDIGQKIGDIAMYSIPQQLSAAQLSNIESMILQARSEASHIAVTDSSSGAVFSYSGTPATIYKYPVKMRVYFADSATDVASSSTYCENGSWLGTNSCALNLAGLTTAQVRYYDFEGNLVQSEPAGPR